MPKHGIEVVGRNIVLKHGQYDWAASCVTLRHKGATKTVAALDFVGATAAILSRQEAAAMLGTDEASVCDKINLLRQGTEQAQQPAKAKPKPKALTNPKEDPSKRERRAMAVELMGLRRKLLSPQQTAALFAQIEDSRFMMLAALCRFPSAVQELKEMHARPDYARSILTFFNAAAGDETSNADSNDDSGDETEALDNTPEADPDTDAPASNTGINVDQRRALILAAAERLEPLLRAYDPLKDPGGKRGKRVADAMQELAGLLRLQPPRDTCLHILSEAAKRDRDDKDKQYRENLYKEPYAFMREHERAMLRAKELLRTHNMRLVLKVAHKRGGRGVDREVLLTEGAMGLVRAIESYDPVYGYAFTTYAVNWIRQRMDRCIDNEARLVRLPVHSGKMHRKLYALKAQFHQKHRRWPSDEELANMADTSTQTVKRLTDSSLTFPHSLSTPLSEGDDQSATIGDMIPDANAENGIIEFANRLQLRAKLTQAMMEVLTWKEERILRMRLGIALNDDQTLEEVGQKFNVTRERIRQIETKALRKLRGKKYIKALAHYNL